MQSLVLHHLPAGSFIVAWWYSVVLPIFFSLLKEKMMMNRKSSPKVYLMGYTVVLVLLPMLSTFNQPAFLQAQEITAREAKRTENGFIRIFHTGWAKRHRK